VAVTVTVSVFEHTVDEYLPLYGEQAPGSSVLDGWLVTPPLSLLTETPVSLKLPVLQTWPLKVTSTPVPPVFTAAVQSLVTLMPGPHVTGQLAPAEFETAVDVRALVAVAVTVSLGLQVVVE